MYLTIYVWSGLITLAEQNVYFSKVDQHMKYVRKNYWLKQGKLLFASNLFIVWKRGHNNATIRLKGARWNI